MRKTGAASSERCGGHLLGYFVPHEGSNDIAWGRSVSTALWPTSAIAHGCAVTRKAARQLRLAQDRRFILREERSLSLRWRGTFCQPPLREA